MTTDDDKRQKKEVGANLMVLMLEMFAYAIATLCMSMRCVSSASRRSSSNIYACNNASCC